MKTIKILIVSIVLLTVTLTQTLASAISTCKQEDLIERMAKDEDVMKILNYSGAMLIAHIGTKGHPEELPTGVKKAFGDITLASKESVKNINLKFPEFTLLNSSEKKEIFSQVANIIYTNSNETGAKLCFFAGLETFRTCTNILKNWEAYRLYLCAAATLLVDVIVWVAEPWLAAGAVTEMELEVTACYYITIVGNTLEEYQVATCAATALLEIVNCITG